MDDGPTQPATVRILERGAGKTVLEIIITEGRKRQVRRMCDAVGHPVLSLQRTVVGPISLGDLRPGDTRRLNPQELADLKQAAALE